LGSGAPSYFTARTAPAPLAFHSFDLRSICAHNKDSPSIHTLVFTLTFLAFFSLSLFLFLHSVWACVHPTSVAPPFSTAAARRRRRHRRPVSAVSRLPTSHVSLCRSRCLPRMTTPGERCDCSRHVYRFVPCFRFDDRRFVSIVLSLCALFIVNALFLSPSCYALPSPRICLTLTLTILQASGALHTLVWLTTNICVTHSQQTLTLHTLNKLSRYIRSPRFCSL
jgi:hypothetical protein